MNRTRYAIVKGHADNADTVAAYLPSNYKVSDKQTYDNALLIEGEDFGGWTLDDYVIPRLGSGWMFAEEVTPF